MDDPIDILATLMVIVTTLGVVAALAYGFGLLSWYATGSWIPGAVLFAIVCLIAWFHE